MAALWRLQMKVYKWVSFSCHMEKKFLEIPPGFKIIVYLYDFHPSLTSSPKKVTFNLWKKKLLFSLTITVPFYLDSELQKGTLTIKINFGTSLAVQGSSGLRHCTSTAAGAGSIPGGELRSRMSHRAAKKKKKIFEHIQGMYLNSYYTLGGRTGESLGGLNRGGAETFHDL